MVFCNNFTEDVSTPLRRFNRQNKKPHLDYEERNPFSEKDLKQLFENEIYLYGLHKKASEQAIVLYLDAETAGIINWALQLSREEVTAVFKTMPDRVRQAYLEAALFNNPLMEWMLDKLRPEPDAVVQVGDKKEFLGSQGEILFEYANERLYPNYKRNPHL